MAFNVPLSEEFSNYYEGSDEEKLKKARIIYAIDLYLQDKTSILKASELAELSLEEFSKELRVRSCE